MHAREIVFEPFDAQHQKDTGNEPVLLRARKEMLERDPKWCAFSSDICSHLTIYFARILFSYLKPESVRVHPEATVRPWAQCQVVGDALSFASAMGYV